MKTTDTIYRMKLTGYQVRTAIGILNKKRLELKEAGHTLENSPEYNRIYNLLTRFLDVFPV